MKKKISFFLLLICSFSGIPAQHTISDSLSKLLANTSSDTAKISLLVQLAHINADIDIKKSQENVNQALELSSRTGYKMDRVLFTLGKVQESAGDNGHSMQSYFKALALAEKNNAKYLEAQILDRIAGVYVVQKDFKNAVAYKNKAIDISRSINDKEGTAISVFNLGNVYYYMEDYDKAIEKYKEVIPYFEESNSLAFLDAAYNNIGAIFFNKENYTPALEYFKKSYQSRIRSNNVNDIASSLNNIGETYGKTGQLDSAITYCNKAVIEGEKAGLSLVLIPAYQNLALLYERKGDFKTASEYHRMYEVLQDSVFNMESQKQLQEFSVKYETDKKEKANEILNLQLKNESFLKYIFIVAFSLLVVVAFFIYRSYHQKKKANLDLAGKNKIIEDQKKLVEEKNKEIVDSINYAQKIQSAIMPAAVEFEKVLGNCFVLLRPKDIVSGDFYWLSEKGDYIFYATADCTGHGVPGGFMSMLGSSLLNEIVNEKKVYEPADILDLLRVKIILALKQKGQSGENKDGMDMVICRINKDRTELCYAAANNPLWLIRNGKCIEYPCDKQPVGISGGELSQFNQNTIRLEKNDAIYTFTDGYADQFGGIKGKKFKYLQLKELLEKNNYLPSTSQKAVLNDTIEAWMGNLEQVDDMLVIGVKI